MKEIFKPIMTEFPHPTTYSECSENTTIIAKEGRERGKKKKKKSYT